MGGTDPTRILKSDGSFFLNIGSAPSNPMLPHEIVMALRGSFVLQNTIHWIKSIAIDTAAAKTELTGPHLNRSPWPGTGGREAFHSESRIYSNSQLRSFQADQFQTVS